MHEGIMLGMNQGLEFGIERREVWMRLDVVQRFVITFVALVLPDMHCGS